MNYPIYHPKTNRCINTDKNGLVTLNKNCNDTKWIYNNGIITNNKDQNLYYKQTNDFMNNIYSGKNNKINFNLLNGIKPYQSRLEFNNNDIKYQLIGDTNNLRARPYKFNNTDMLDFESPIFNKDNTNLYVNWYDNEIFKNNKKKIKKDFKKILESDLNMMNNCCKHNKNSHKELCGKYWGPSKSCENLLNNHDKIQCCFGLGNIYRCGKYWGPNRNDKCKDFIINYCLDGPGYSDEKCACLTTTLLNNKKTSKKVLKRILDDKCIFPISSYFYMSPEKNKYIQEHFENNNNTNYLIFIIILFLFSFLLIFKFL